MWIAFWLNQVVIILQLFVLFSPDHCGVFATTKIQFNYIPLSHYISLSSPALGDNRGIHHTISCKQFYKLSKILHGESSNYRILHYTLKYALCLCPCVCLCEWWWYYMSCSLLMTDDAFPRGEEKKWWQVATSLTSWPPSLSIFCCDSLCCFRFSLICLPFFKLCLAFLHFTGCGKVHLWVFSLFF